MKKLYTSVMAGAMSLFMFGALSAQSIICGSNEVFPEDGENYPSNANETWLVEPETPGDIVTISFNAFGTESCCDHLFVYEGADDSGVQLADLVGTDIPASISSATGLFLNFTSDGSVTQIGFDLDVTCATPENDLIAFSIPEQTGPAVIDAENHTVNIEATFGTELSALIPSFELSAFASATVAGVAQESAVTANDFTTAVTYTVNAANDAAQDWLVTITVAAGASDAKDFLTYSIGGVEATVGDNTIDLTLSPFIDISSQIASFESSDFSTVAIADVAQESAVTANDFSNPLVYTVTAQDGSTKDYIVTAVQSDICTSSIDFPAGDDNYPNNANETWLISPDTDGDIVTIDFTSFGTEACCDHLFVYEGADDTGTLLFDLVGTSIPASISSANGLFLNFTSDGSVTSSGFALDISCATPENNITAFSFAEQTSPATIDTENHTVDIEVSFGTDLSALIASYELSAFATTVIVDLPQESGVTTNDFTAAVVYTVTAANGTTQDWTVNTTAAAGASDAKDMLSFSVIGVEATIGANTVDLNLNAFVDLSSLVASFESSLFSTVAIADVDQETGVTVNDFTGALVYTVTAQDGTTKDYVVTITQDDVCGASIDFPSGDESYPSNSDVSWQITPDTDGDVVTLDFTSFGTETCCDHLFVYEGTDDTGTLLFDLVGTDIPTSISSANGLFLNFTSDGSVTNEGFALDISCETPENDIVDFSLAAQTGLAVIDAENHTVAVEVALGTDLTALIATFELSTFATATVADVVQESEISANDFSTALVYNVTASNGLVQDWTVTVTAATTLSDSNDMLTFSINGIDAVIGENTIDITLDPFDPIVTDLVATFTTSPFSDATIGDLDQESGVSENDFTDPVVYTVTAQDGTTQDYTVSVSVGEVCGTSFTIDSGSSSNETDETFVMIPPTGQAITLDFTSWSIDLGFWNDVVTIYDGPSTGSPVVAVYGNGAANPGPITSTSPDGALTLFFEVGSAANNDTDVVANVTCGPGSSENDILTFEMVDQTGDADIDAEAHTVILEVAFGTDLTALTADFTLSDAALASIADAAQESGTTLNDYTTALTYTVTAQDGTTQDWTVTVTASPTASEEKDMLTFSVNGLDATIGETSIDLSLGAFVDITDLTPVFTSSLFSTVAVADVAQETAVTANDFSTVLIYTVTAQDGSTKDYTVTITKDDVCGVNLDFPLGDGNYDNNLNESWIIAADTPGDVVTIDFNSFGTETCCDHLFVYEGNDDSGELLFDLVGTDIPASISSLEGLFLNFTSDGSVTNTGFDLTVSCAAPSSDASLVDLTVDGTTVAGFASDVFEYTVVLPSGTVDVPVVVATVNDATATAELSDLDALPGDVIVTVTAQDGAVLTYTVTFEVALSDDTSLADLLVDGETVDGFDSEIFDYTVVLPFGTTDVPVVVATVNDATATAELSDLDALPGDVIVTVTAEDGSTQTYTISFEVSDASGDARLADLTVDGNTIADFDPLTLEYTVYLQVGTTTVPDVVGTANHDQATVDLLNAAAIPGDATLTVTAENGVTMQEYIIHFAHNIGVDELGENTISLYPNPTSDVLIIEGNFVCEEMELLSAEGQLVRKITKTGKQTKVNVQELAEGVYFLQSCQSVQKVLIRH